jgi:hypothetical protein
MPSGDGGSLLINGGQSGIGVFVNGAQYGRTSAAGLLRIPVLPAGEYDVRLEKPGFQFVSQQVHIVAQQETRLTFDLSPLSAARVDNLLIRSLPVGAKVDVDGISVGSSNANGELSLKVDPGVHEIELEHTDYVPRTLKIEVTARGNQVVEGKLQQDSAALAFVEASRSNNTETLEAFLKNYPTSKGAPQIRVRLEDLEWVKYRNYNDPVQLEAFIEKHPNGGHIGEARELAAKFQQEDIDWHDARSLNTIDALQLFVVKHPQGRYLADAQRSISLLQDQAQVLQVLRDYEDAFNRQDFNRLLLLWPNFPLNAQAALNNQFKAKKSGILRVSPKGTPEVKDDRAVLSVTITRQTESSHESRTVPFTFQKQNDHWAIEHGAF